MSSVSSGTGADERDDDASKEETVGRLLPVELVDRNKTRKLADEDGHVECEADFDGAAPAAKLFADWLEDGPIADAKPGIVALSLRATGAGAGFGLQAGAAIAKPLAAAVKAGTLTTVDVSGHWLTGAPDEPHHRPTAQAHPAMPDAHSG
jgi:hypothetical protein